MAIMLMVIIAISVCGIVYGMEGWVRCTAKPVHPTPHYICFKTDGHRDLCISSLTLRVRKSDGWQVFWDKELAQETAVICDEREEPGMALPSSTLAHLQVLASTAPRQDEKSARWLSSALGTLKSLRSQLPC